MTFQSKDVNVGVFSNELTPPVSGLLHPGVLTSRFVAGRAFAADERLQGSLWDSLRAPRFAIRKGLLWGI